MSWADYEALAAAVDAEADALRRLGAFTYRHRPTVEGAARQVPVRTAYTVWEGPSERTIVCAGGIANTAHRFDFLGTDLAGRFNILCLDWAGRGRSGWLPDLEDYGFETYVTQLEAFIEEVARGPVTIVGSSIGGSAGMCLAARRPDLVDRLVLNDSGAFIPKERRQRRARAVGRHYVFHRPADMFRRSGAAQKHDGPVEDAALLHNAHHQTRWSEADGGRIYRHDPRALLAYRAAAETDLDLWPVWSQVTCPVLVLHGLESDALSKETLAAMAAIRGFDAIDVPATGHTPTLSCANQIALIATWLETPERIGARLTCLPSARGGRFLFPLPAAG